MEFVGAVDAQGLLDFDTRCEIAQWLRTFSGRTVAVKVKQYRPTRSSRANRYYWSAVVPALAEHCGYDDKNEMHEALAMKFLRIEDCPITGAPRRKRTPRTNSKEFSDYVDACIRLAAELGVVIPEPQSKGA